MDSTAAGRDVSGLSSWGDTHTLWLALALTLPTIGLEQLLHTDRWTLTALPLYQALHWLSDSLLALPLAGGAVWGGQRLADRLGLDASTPQGIAGRAALIVLLFAFLLVPGAGLHDAADRLTHVHAGAAIHSHIPLQVLSAGRPASLARFTSHALSDAFKGQAVGLPATILALMVGRKSRARDLPAITPKEA